MKQLPNGWVEATLSELGVWRGGGTPSKQNPSFWTNGDIPWVSPKDMKQRYIADSEDHITSSAVENSATQTIPKQSVLIVTRSGSEARDKVSYWQVDHYRPKKIYPWLAFDWRNFRLCGSRPNRRKTDRFPLEDESQRASATSPDLNAERPLLLDPVRWGDPELMTFKADGEPTCAVPADALAVARVRETVSTLELDSAILCEERRAKWRECETKLKKLRELVDKARQRANADAAEFSMDLCRDIAKLFDDKAEFTATANACSAELQAGSLVDLARKLSQRASLAAV